MDWFPYDNNGLRHERVKFSLGIWFKNLTKFSYFYLFLVIYQWKKHSSELC